MLCLNFNQHDAFKYLNKSFNLNIEKNIIEKIYQKLRYVLYKYLYLFYRLDLLAYNNKHKTFSIDGILLSHRKIMGCKSG